VAVAIFARATLVRTDAVTVICFRFVVPVGAEICHARM
jgi:hypothetical protein